MISILLALAAAQAAQPWAMAPVGAPVSEEEQLKDCIAVVQQAPDRAVAAANDWLVKGGGLPARQCLGQAYAALARWAPAAAAFEEAAREAETIKDPARADFWVQAGNAWLAGSEPVKARQAFNAALATTLLAPELRGEVHLDRARAHVAVGDLPSARADIDKGLELVPADPFGWYLSSALALKEENMPLARDHIARAMQLAPDDADVLLQAGTVAGLSGEVEAARLFYEKAAKRAPDSPAGKAAAQALAANENPPRDGEGDQP
jgi:tetratricopeptide (TPR) repeat protein